MTDDTPSPCINVCRMDPDSGLCAGCLRTIDEIAGWGGYSDAEKRAVLRNIEARRHPARSGRAWSLSE